MKNQNLTDDEFLQELLAEQDENNATNAMESREEKPRFDSKEREEITKFFRRAGPRFGSTYLYLLQQYDPEDAFEKMKVILDDRYKVDDEAIVSWAMVLLDIFEDVDRCHILHLIEADGVSFSTGDLRRGDAHYNLWLALVQFVRMKMSLPLLDLGDPSGSVKANEIGYRYLKQIESLNRLTKSKIEKS